MPSITDVSNINKNVQYVDSENIELKVLDDTSENTIYNIIFKELLNIDDKEKD